MGGDFLGCSNCPCIFFYKVFYSLDTNAFSLSRVEESVFMSGYRSNSLPNCQVLAQSPFHFRTEVYNHFIAAFSGDLDTIIFKINILHIQSYTFRYTYSCAKQESNNSQIPFFCFFIISPFLSGKLIAAMFYVIQQESNLIGIQPNNAFIMDLWYIHKNSWICFYEFMFKIIGVKAS